MKIQKPGREKYDIIAVKNLYNTQRQEHTPRPVSQKQPLKPVSKPVVEPDPTPEMIEILEKKDLYLFGVVIMNDLTLALINDVGGENQGKQIWVKQKDIIGDYTIEKILPEAIIVSYEKKQYKVPLFDKREKNEKHTPKKIVAKNKKSVSAKLPVVLSTKKEDLKEKKESEEYEWVILNTPFGERRIKRKK
ncbi:MAG: hypothetical protein K8S13_09060 [Desulfobacula sp.]|uniref:hypothetical protein n=1 Tax=Desulfobacula sp. TaxID=2593537 RepID=UPI0025C21706|nr:hypothetical protein [Desulfobacula sp.]MCD4719993.1 hypothetical protein [Desulfobacula sp.]